MPPSNSAPFIRVDFQWALNRTDSGGRPQTLNSKPQTLNPIYTRILYIYIHVLKPTTVFCYNSEDSRLVLLRKAGILSYPGSQGTYPIHKSLPSKKHEVCMFVVFAKLLICRHLLPKKKVCLWNLTGLSAAEETL